MPDPTTTLLTAAGMSAAEAANKAALFERCEKALDHSAAPEKSVRYFVPGRIEFLGKHTDYCGGRSLLCTTERGICIVARPRSDASIRIAALDLHDHAEFPLSPDLTPPAAHWSNYVMTVARRIARNFTPPFHGADIAFASDLPHAAGMSSSSALIIAVFLVLRDLLQLDTQPAYQQNIHTPEDLAGYLATIENGQSFGTLAGDKGVGTFGGSQDHTAILCSKAAHLVQYSFCPVRPEAAIPWPQNHTLAIAVSGVTAEKTGAAMDHYNNAAQRAATIVRLWHEKTHGQEPTVAAIIASSPDAPDRLRQILQDPVLQIENRKSKIENLPARLEQFLAESTRIIPAAADAIAHNHLTHLGTLVDLSQANAENLLGNQVPETITLARQARDLGALAASAFGAGFGGAVWAMIPSSGAMPCGVGAPLGMLRGTTSRKNGHAPDNFVRDWQNRYLLSFPAHAPQGPQATTFFLTQPGPPATKV